MDTISYARIGADTLMEKFKPEELPPANRFHYHQGVFLAGVEQIYNITGDEKYRNYIKEWIDFNIDDKGKAKNCCINEFDDIQPGILLFDLYNTTGDERYKILLDKFANKILNWPTNFEGGVWHKYRCPNQIWLDSMYMMGIFSTKYAFTFDCPKLFDMVYTLMMQIKTHMTDPKNGLLYHMYDESRRHRFVDKLTGLIPIHWGRAMGWVAVALTEILEIIPKNHKYYNEILDFDVSFLNAVKNYQDKNNGMWYQIVDMPNDDKNWHETSATALFTYAAAKALKLGIVDKSFKNVVENGLNGELTKIKIENNKMDISGICIGTGVGPVDYYFRRPTSSNDLHGMGAFLLMCTEIYKLENK